MIGVILAGGSGTRFWPKSRELYPKQFLRIAGSKTMLQYTVERILPLTPIEKIFVVTNELHALETCRQLAEYGFAASNLLAEPDVRNTAPALGFAAEVLRNSGNKDEVMAVFPADHVVNDPAPFHDALRQAEAAALRGCLVTLGVQPTRPETGYGYIEKGLPLDGLPAAFKAEAFVEKPNAETAQKFLDNGAYFWNCGIFLWKVSVVLEEMKNLMPEMAESLAAIASNVQTRKGRYPYVVLDAQGRETYRSFASISIDYGIMEKSTNVLVVPVQMQWNDVGSWTALEEIGEKDADGNVFTQDVVSIDCSGSIIQGEGRLIAGVGLKDLVIVDTPDALLVCDKERAQDVKKLAAKIKAERRPEVSVHATVRKPWGSYTVLEKVSNRVVKRLEVYPGEKLSLQSHQNREEHWFVAEGRAEVQKGEEIFFLDRNETVFIPKATKHRLGNPDNVPLTVIEIQIGACLDENDIIRYEDVYGRA